MGEPKRPDQFYQKLGSPTETDKKAQESLEVKIKQLFEKLSAKYKIDQKEIFFGLEDLRSKLTKPIEVFGGIDNLEGKRILDIGCGTINSRDTKVNSRTFEPWLCRALLELGAHPVGVDLNPNILKEEFEHHQLNLLSSGALNIFPDKSFDGINVEGLFDSPTIDNIFVSKDEIKRMKEEIGKQIKRLLKDDGKILNILNYADGGVLRAELGF